MTGLLSESVCTKELDSTMQWKNPAERTDGRAVSPVIGVIMMVAVTVILAAVVSMLVLNMGGDVNASPQASFSFEYTPNAANGTVELTHEGGDSLDPAKVKVLVDGNPDSTDTWSDPISAGSSYTTDATLGGGETIKVVWTSDNGETAVLATYTVPS